MTRRTRTLIERNFKVNGAVRRGVVFLAVMTFLAYVPQVAEAMFK